MQGRQTPDGGWLRGLGPHLQSLFEVRGRVAVQVETGRGRHSGLDWTQRDWTVSMCWMDQATGERMFWGFVPCLGEAILVPTGKDYTVDRGRNPDVLPEGAGLVP